MLSDCQSYRTRAIANGQLATGEVVNQSDATISGSLSGGVQFTASGTLLNGGAITSIQDGVDFGTAGTYTAMASYMSNTSSGTIISTGGSITFEGKASYTLPSNAVDFRGSGTLVNAGTLDGSVDANGKAAVAIVNSGLILGISSAAVGLGIGGIVMNQASGVIYGAAGGIYMSGGASTVVNAGLITATSTLFQTAIKFFG
jgi:hypothetical protein